MADRDGAFAVADDWLYAQDGAGRIWTAHAREGRAHRLRVAGAQAGGLSYGLRMTLTAVGDRVYAEVPHPRHELCVVALRHGRVLWQRAAGDTPLPCGEDVLLPQGHRTTPPTGSCAWTVSRGRRPTPAEPASAAAVSAAVSRT
ncbi:hypothetical protein [Streptomyces sp. NPDC058964]|uniref:hypothetical protein n=1 Tax=Streptomyces sp. NPDC058964 TaxID=3346681 RepID=UPI00367FDDB1